VRRLSDCKILDTFAFCEKCKEFFIDDILLYGSIKCPNKCGWCLRRGYTKQAVKDLAGDKIAAKVLQNGFKTK